MLPNFLVIGAAKSATTSLCELLGQHPDVFILDPKEPHFFTRHYELGWKWYKSLFSNAGSYERIGEGSTSYSQKGLYPGAAKTIYQYLPDTLLIYIVRHPLERIESQWYQEIKSVRKALPFCQAVRHQPKLLDPSRYWLQINEFRNYYPDNRILAVL